MAEENEIWKDVVGYEGLYQVSNIGRIKGLKRPSRNKNGPVILKEKLLKQSKNNVTNRLSVCLCKNLSIKRFYIHRLVLEAFIGPCPEGYESCHKNDVQTDNRLDNLYWGTKEQNIQDKIRNEKICFGEKHGRSKLKELDIFKIRELLNSNEMSQYQIAKKYNVTQSTISNINTKKKWTTI